MEEEGEAARQHDGRQRLADDQQRAGAEHQQGCSFGGDPRSAPAGRTAGEVLDRHHAGERERCGGEHGSAEAQRQQRRDAAPHGDDGKRAHAADGRSRALALQTDQQPERGSEAETEQHRGGVSGVDDGVEGLHAS